MLDETTTPGQRSCDGERQSIECRRAQARELIDDLPISVLVLKDGAVVAANDGWTAMIGMSAEQSIGSQWLSAVHADDVEVARDLACGLDGHPVRSTDLRLRPASERDDFWVHARSRFVGEGTAQTCVMTLTEIGARKSNELRLMHLATHDELTGLANRSGFMSALDHLLRANSGTNLPVVVMFVDLDGFKRINDLHGHTVGDQVLQIVGARLRQAVRPGDTAARLGGDEFAIVCPSVGDSALAARLADRVLSGLNAPVEMATIMVPIAASIGLAISADRDLSAEGLLHDADRAMYRSKSTGGNRWTAADPSGPSAGVSLKHGSTRDQLPADLRYLFEAMERRLVLLLDDIGTTDRAKAATIIGELLALISVEVDALAVMSSITNSSSGGSVGEMA